MCENYDKIIVLRQLKPIIKRDPDAGILTFAGKLLNNGKECGALNGETKLTPSLKNNKHKTRIRNLYFNLIYGQIMAQGLSDEYNSAGLLENSHITAIVGGTKEYEGISGKIKTTRIKDTNEYEHIVYINYPN